MPRFFSTSVRSLFVNLGISIIVAILVLLVTQDLLFEIPPLQRAELSLIDLRFQQRSKTMPATVDSPEVVIVGINQESFRSLPAHWPWPKSYYSRLIRNLHKAGAKAIGLDIIFSSNDTIGSAEDRDFVSALRETGGVVLAGKLEPDQPGFMIRRSNEDYGNAYTSAAKYLGLVNVPTDVDGIIRRYMPFVYDSAQGKRIPTFSFAILNAYFDQQPTYTADPNGSQFFFFGKQIPRYDSTSFLLNYYGPSGTFHPVNFADVLDDSEFQTAEEIEHPGVEINTFSDPDDGYLTDGTFKNKIVIVGSIMPEDKDLFPVSIGEGRLEGDNLMYGVEIHANVMQSVLDNRFILRQPGWLTALVVFGLSLITFALTAGLKAIRTKFSAHLELLGLAIVAAEMVIIYWLSMKLFIEQHYLTDMISPMLTVIGCYIGSTIYNYVTERQQRLLIKNMFSQYVNPTVVDELLAHPEKLRLGGERKVLTVFFSDIESFTRISETMPPENLVAILNEYLNVMTAIVLTNDGTLDKYEGDAIVAFWGAPIPQNDHALRACRAAVQMQRSLNGLRQLWEQEGKPALRVRIGINSGEVIVGNMGGANRFDYTAIGDNVNLGARLESANKQYKTSILISESTYRIVAPHVLAREIDYLIVSGKTRPIRVYELIDILGDDTVSSEQMRFIEVYHHALACFRNREWHSAIVGFENALSIMPGDYTSTLYIERAQAFLVSPPPENWDGVVVLTMK